MITLHDVDAAWDEGTNSDIDKLARKLLAERDEALAKADAYRQDVLSAESKWEAYREVAANNLSGKMFGQTMEECLYPEQMYRQVDTEAQRISKMLRSECFHLDHDCNCERGNAHKA